VTFTDNGTPFEYAYLVYGVATLNISNLSPGVHDINAIYAGDPNYFGVNTLNQVPIVVNPAPTTTTLVGAANPAVVGQPVTLIAAVKPIAPGSGNPDGGQVAFYDAYSLLGIAPVANGTASLSTTALSLGSHLVRAVYLSNATDAVSYSPFVTHLITQDIATIGIEALQGATEFGQMTTFGVAAAVNPPGAAPIDGSIVFFDGANAIGAIPYHGGFAAFTTPVLSPGHHTISAFYTGNANVAPARSFNVDQTVVPDNTLTIVQSTAPTAIHGQTVTYVATVFPDSYGGGAPDGTVQFYDGQRFIATVALVGGQAAVSVFATTPGIHNIYALYSGSPNFLASDSAPFAETVLKSNTTLAAFAQVFPGGVGFPT
jgi:hypothetical protein